MALTKVKGHIIADDLALGGNPTTSTQSASDNSTKIATTAYVTTAVSNLVDGAPSTLNTLNEIAAALNDDAALNTTLTNSIATKAPLASPNFTGQIQVSNAASTIQELTVTGNNTRSTLRLNSKDSSGNSVDLRMHSLGDGPRAELFTYSNHDLAFATNNGAPQMTLDTSGNFGIGTQSPGSLLHIHNDSVAGNTQLHIHNNKTGDAAVLKLEGKRTSLNDTGQILFANNGNLVAKIDARSAADDGELRFFTSATGSGGSISQRMVIDGSGNVHINETVGRAQLNLSLGNVTGAGQFASSQLNLSNPTNVGAISQITFGYDAVGLTNAASYIGYLNGSSSSNGKGSLVFGTRDAVTDTQPTERMRIDSAGHVGIGLINPSDYYATDLVVSSASEKGITIASTGTSNANYLMFADGTSGDQRYRGYIGYGHSNDHLAFAAAGTEKMRIDGDGSIHVVGSSPAGIYLDNNNTRIYHGTNRLLEGSTDSTAVVSLAESYTGYLYCEPTIRAKRGISFGTDTATANQLDDYEEGTFDAQITPGSGSYTLNSSYSKFGYTKIGRVVTITGMVVISGASGASGSVTIGDLPFEMLNATERSSQTRPSIHIYANGSGAPASAYYSAFIAFNEGNRSGTLIVTHNNTHDATPGDWLTGGSDIFMNFSYHAA